MTAEVEWPDPKWFSGQSFAALASQSIDRRKDANLAHSSHAFGCDVCTEILTRLDALRRKNKKLRKRVQVLESKLMPRPAQYAEYQPQRPPAPGEPHYDAWKRDAEALRQQRSKAFKNG